MPELETEYKDQIKFELGYEDLEISPIQGDLDRVFSDFRYGRIIEVCDRLRSVEATRVENLGDTLATKVGSIELNYKQHYKMLYQEGYDLIENLARLVNVQEYINRFEKFLTTPGSSIQAYTHYF